MSASVAHVPMYFRSGTRTLFGWLHAPDRAPPGGLGLIICKPFGYEATCAHRSVRAFATAAAKAGVPTLEFDYGGTGDSEDLPSGDDQLVSWVDDTLSAVSELQRLTGVRRVCLLGIRLGGLLATLAAARSSAVVGLLVIAPVISGRRYLRELRIVQLAAPRVPVAAPDASVDIRATDGDSLEVSGFSLEPATTRTLMSTDLMALGAPPAARVLIIDRTDLPAARAWADALAKLGAQVDYDRLPGLVEMIWTAPHFAAVPHAMLARTAEWLRQFMDGKDAPVPALSAPSSLLPAAGVRAPPRSMSVAVRSPRAACVQVRECAVEFGSQSPLFGIVTEPPAGELRQRGVILVNDGATHHIGANRINVSLGRQWAARGYVVLRMDLAGLGDSATRAGRPDNEVFPPAAIDDIRAAVEYLRTQYGANEITVGGLCAGAYHALRSAVAALPVNRILMVNPQNFFWDEGMTLSEVQLADVVKNPSVYRERVLSMASWKKLISGKVDLWRIARIHIHRGWLSLDAMARELARRLHIRRSQDLGLELEEIVGRGVQVIFIFSRDEPGMELLRIQAGSSLARLGDRCRIHIIDDADHLFSQSGPRRQLEDLLSEELFIRRLPESDASDSDRTKPTAVA